MTKINCFIAYSKEETDLQYIHLMETSPLIHKIFLLSTDRENNEGLPYPVLYTDQKWGTQTINLITTHSDCDYTLISTKTDRLELGLFTLERFTSIAEDTQAGVVYSDYHEIKEGQRTPHPLIDYQPGSLRDDFSFGSLLFYRTEALKKANNSMDANYLYAGLYDLRLKVSQEYPIIHINEYLYTEIEKDTRLSGAKQFDYVNPKNRAVQIEMEKACTEYLKRTGAYLPPQFKTINFNKGEFAYEVSVIIPVRNRVRTIEDAIRSAFAQKTSFPYNVIIVDNHSSDGTGEVIGQYMANGNLIHIIPEREDLGIGGCWNLAVHHPDCGKFAIQLDSDDLYSDEYTLQKIRDAFYDQQCGMVVGTYQMTDFNLSPIPPGVIDHKEWTPDNGRNNALRINGLGAPRAFYTPLLRSINLPNTSYGEDYALGLRISREYQIGRIYDVLYLCRRWEENSDASLDVSRINTYNLYKDRIRTWELQARINILKR